MANTFTIHCGDSAEVLKQYPDNHFDSVVTDPPYGIDFLGKEWDAHTGTIELWKQVFRVLKPGGHMLAFSAARTYHRLATNIEDVGFEIRDQIMWIYSSGFPKAQDVGKQIDKRTPGKESPEAKQWEGWKSSLKPGHEPIVLARKPVTGSILDNVLKYGTGALNIDAARVPYEDDANKSKQSARWLNWKAVANGGTRTEYTETLTQLSELGRYPSNVLGDIPEYQKYFYCPKVSRAERHIGFDKGLTGYEKLLQMGGHYTDKDGNPSGKSGSGCWTPQAGITPIHAVNSIFEEFSQTQQTQLSIGDEASEKQQSPNIKTLAEVAIHFGCTNIDGTPFTGGNTLKVPEIGNIYIHGLIAELNKIHGEDVVNKYRGINNNHPTVKPVELMKYLVKLITPKGGTVLDPFNGSGSTGMAALAEGCNYVGCDLDQNYVDIANTRIAAYRDNGFSFKINKSQTNFQKLFSQ